jgi:hypothetical protein
VKYPFDAVDQRSFGDHEGFCTGDARDIAGNLNPGEIARALIGYRKP